MSQVTFIDISNSKLYLHYVTFCCSVVPPPTVTVFPPGPIQGAMVGSRQDIQCTVSTVSGVELSSVMISWMGPGGDTIRNDSRVTISPITDSGSTFTSVVDVSYLTEGDEGIYQCNVEILETTASHSMEIGNLSGTYSKLLTMMQPSIHYIPKTRWSPQMLL